VRVYWTSYPTCVGTSVNQSNSPVYPWDIRLVLPWTKLWQNVVRKKESEEGCGCRGIPYLMSYVDSHLVVWNGAPGDEIFKLQSWRWWQHIPPKRQYPLTRLHGITTQKTMIWTIATMNTSKLILIFIIWGIGNLNFLLQCWQLDFDVIMVVGYRLKTMQCSVCYGLHMHCHSDAMHGPWRLYWFQLGFSCLSGFRINPNLWIKPTDLCNYSLNDLFKLCVYTQQFVTTVTWNCITKSQRVAFNPSCQYLNPY
jgi:uncharacterized protein (DUF486 family)